MIATVVSSVVLQNQLQANLSRFYSRPSVRPKPASLELVSDDGQLNDQETVAAGMVCVKDRMKSQGRDRG